MLTKKVLIPTDFSDNAWDALTYAIRLYDDIPCKFYILNTYKVSSSRVTNTMNRERNTYIYRAQKEESEHGLKKIEKFLKENLLNNKHLYEIISKSGELITSINNLIFSENIDMLVMGTTGATGAKEIFMGSNTVKAIKNINLCPILSVPENYEYKELEQVVLANDLKKNFTKMDLKCLIELQQLHNFKIHIVHVKKEGNIDTLQSVNKEILFANLKESNIVFEEVTLKDNITNTINNYAHEHNASLIIMANYEHSFIEILTHEAIIKKISFHSNIPLLILPIN